MFGPLAADECDRLGIALADYLDAYDCDAAQPYAGVAEVIAHLDGRWALCSNKVASAGRRELARLQWSPLVAMFAEDFGGPKRLGPVLDRLGVRPGSVLFVGDTAHDRACAAEVGVRFALAAWNPRATAEPGDIVLAEPADLLAYC